MGQLSQTLEIIKGWVWGAPLLILLMGTGIYLTFLLRGMQFRYLGYALKQAFTRPAANKDSNAKGDINHFEALMTSLAGAIGTGTIAGVATAIAVGGLGAIFWMWVMALFGMATKYAESLLAVKYREMDKRGEMSGGPMQYMEKGLGWKWVPIFFAIAGSFAAIGTGNLVQVNSISEAFNSLYPIDAWWVGIALAVMTGLIIIGGVKSIGQVAGIMVPFMALFYIGGGIIIIIMNYERIPEAFGLIIRSAFTGQAAFGGFAGSTIMAAIQMGVARSVFSNEAGMGISTFAAAAAKTDSPGRQAMITMTGALISTVVVCTITGLVLAVTNVFGQVGEDGRLLNGATMAIQAFQNSLFGGKYIIAIGLILFAFTTVIAWAYYGEKCFEYLFGAKSVLIYRAIYTLIVIPGAALQLEISWHIADIANGLMILPNLLALIGLRKVIKLETDKFLVVVKNEKNPAGVFQESNA